MKIRRTGIAILVTTAVVSGIGIYRNREFVHDDTFISLRYCQNFLEGHGLTWNPGERVEGYTDFLHILLVAGLGATGLDLLLAARLINFSAFALMLLFMWRFMRRQAANEDPEPSSLGANVPLMLAGTSLPLISWCWGGLEGPVFALFITVGVYLTVELLKRRSTSRAALTGTAFALAILCRPDGAIFAAVSLFSLFVPVVSRKRGAVRDAVIFSATCFAPVCAHLIWRVWYYGDWLPNTYYVKATGLPHFDLESSLGYVLSFCASPPFLLPLGLLAAIIALRTPRYRAAVLCVLANMGAYLWFIMSIGGDHMPAHRLMLPLIPLACLLIHLALSVEVRAISPKENGIVCVLAMILVGLQIAQPPLRNDPAAFLGTAVGRYVRENWPAGALIALNTAGSTPYHAPDFVYLDMLGLNDRHIARRNIDAPTTKWQQMPGHAKGDGAYVLSRKPDFIILGAATGCFADDPMFLSDVELRDSDEFSASYRPRRVPVDAGSEAASRQFGRPHSGRLWLIYYERIRNAQAP